MPGRMWLAECRSRVIQGPTCTLLRVSLGVQSAFDLRPAIACASDPAVLPVVKMLGPALPLVTLVLSLSALLNARAEQVVLEHVTSRPLSTLPVDNSTQSFWLRSPGVSPSPTEGSEGVLTSDADVCIIGSGITGVSAAYHLAQSLGSLRVPKPINAVILEAREFC